MNDISLGGGPRCSQKSWMVAIVAGLLVFFLMMGAGGYNIFPALVVAILTLILVGLVISLFFCGDMSGSTSSRLGSIAGTMPHDEIERMKAERSRKSASTRDVAAPTPNGILETPNAPVPQPPVAQPPAAAAPEPAVPEASVPEPAAPVPNPPVASGPLVRPTAVLAGQADLASRKGSWKYEAPKPAAEETHDGDYDGDGVVEGTEEGTKPPTLHAARDGGPDDLKQIKGVGPKLEGLLHSLGFFHFDQVAAWTADEVAWVDANLEGFKGRVSRDDWVAQAKVLASGGDTEFSKRVEEGDVY